MRESGEVGEKTRISRRDFFGAAVVGAIGATVAGEILKARSTKEPTLVPKEGDVHEERRNPESGFTGSVDFSSPLLKSDETVRKMLSGIAKGNIIVYEEILSGNPDTARWGLSIIAKKSIEALREIMDSSEIPPETRDSIAKLLEEFPEQFKA